MNEIKVYTDEKLMDLRKRFSSLEIEETGFLINQEEINENNRTMKDVANDMISIYQETNNYLKSSYPNNKVAESWIAINEFCANLLKENWL